MYDKEIRTTYLMQGLNLGMILLCSLGGFAALYVGNIYGTALAVINFALVFTHGYMFNRWFAVRDRWRGLDERYQRRRTG